MPIQALDPLQRWRLVLGESAQAGLGDPGMDADLISADAALSWLYGRESEGGARDTLDRQGGSEGSKLTVPEWISDVHRLFPKETIERLEQDAVERYQILEVVTHPEVLQRVEPNPVLLKAILQTKHLMDPAVLAMARELVARVVKDLIEKLAKEVRASFSGTRDRRHPSSHHRAINFDIGRTVRENLSHFDPVGQRLVIQRPLFWSRTRHHALKWQIILVVDQSGSMLDSTIHAAITAACLWNLPSIRTHLIAFDTSVVDLTRDVSDPVELLMKVQLGGGTDIAKAMQYASGLVENPRRTIIALITDFYEGGSAWTLESTVKSLCEQGTVVLGLCALDKEANPSYDRDLAGRLANVGAHVGAMTPGQLATFIAEKVGA